MLPKRRSFAILALMLMLVACAPTEPRPLHTSIATDEFRKTVDIDGPYGGTSSFGGTQTLFRLETRVDKQTHGYVHVLRAAVSFIDRPFNFVYAADDTAEQLRLVRIARERADCAVCDGWEKFQIDISDAALRAHAATGYAIKVSSRDEYSVILTISPAMIATQLAGLEEFLKTGTVASQ